MNKDSQKKEVSVEQKKRNVNSYCSDARIKADQTNAILNRPSRRISEQHISRSVCTLPLVHTHNYSFILFYDK
jgi:hypothetical protein